ncbi:MAG: GPR endopeptidase [Lachnospiraceae bacterium]|nr:GPR endopeptidase [Lachnospiraceae bacterium]
MEQMDLALEAREKIHKDVEIPGVTLKSYPSESGRAKISNLRVISEEGRQRIGKEIGNYVTIELEQGGELDAEKYLYQELKALCGGEKRRYLIVGLGNREITSDAIGPYAIENVYATSHFSEKTLKKNRWKAISVLSPGVMAQTGMEVQKIIKPLVEQMKIEQVIAIDSLAARNVSRLGNTIQITDTGICPGGGIGNARKELNKDTLGVEVIAIGVPTVVYAETIVRDYVEIGLKNKPGSGGQMAEWMEEIKNSSMEDLLVTGKDVNLQVRKMSKIIAAACNRFSGIGSEG